MSEAIRHLTRSEAREGPEYEQTYEARQARMCQRDLAVVVVSRDLGRRLGEHRRWSQSGHKTVATSTR